LAAVREDLQKTMWEDVGIIRNAESLSKAMAIVSQLKREQIPKLSARNIFSSLECMNLV
jgi:succinate dehydrogenase/fumarate reductase flavoprotein subunit